MNSSKILNHIQTLRAFSVLIVFLYHSNLEIFSSGYLGVDIFFVISGYVISSRILNFDLTKDNVDLKNFYVKRAKRIIPNLVFIVSICYIAYLLLGPSDQTIFSAAIFSILGVSNLYYINNSRDYFDNIFIDPLGHTWSLGVEEQFYIFFPILIFFIFKFSNQKLRNLKIFFIIIFVISLFFYYLNYKSRQGSDAEPGFRPAVTRPAKLACSLPCVQYRQRQPYAADGLHCCVGRGARHHGGEKHDADAAG